MICLVLNGMVLKMILSLHQMLDGMSLQKTRNLLIVRQCWRCVGSLCIFWDFRLYRICRVINIALIWQSSTVSQRETILYQCTVASGMFCHVLSALLPCCQRSSKNFKAAKNLTSLIWPWIQQIQTVRWVYGNAENVTTIPECTSNLSNRWRRQ